MSDIITEIAEDLYNARTMRTPIEFVRHRLPEQDKDAAYRISELVTQQREAAEGRRRVGRKVGLTNPVVQERAGVDEPYYGINLDDKVFESRGRAGPAARGLVIHTYGDTAFVDGLGGSRHGGQDTA